MDLPMTHSRAKGGTMVIWHSSLSPHIRVLPTSSPSFVSVLLSPSPLKTSSPQSTLESTYLLQEGMGSG